MLLKGSCHCGAVQFSVQSPHPYPFNLCYCSICRKTAGGGGYAINLGGDYQTLKIAGKEHLRAYRAKLRDARGHARQSQAQRHFCGECGSALWLWDPRWPELVHPHASAIDTPLPAPPERTHMMLASRAQWVPVHAAPGDKQCDEYPDESLAAWHQRLGLESD
ncbi:MAG: GFA family protein [Gammaproteobacteria bacterium]|nr:GFA family protein [Gammaproteobacteria bacterium]